MHYQNSSLFTKIFRFTILFLVSLSFACSNESVFEKNSPPTSTASYKPPKTAPTPVDSKVNQYDLQMLDGGSVKINDLVGNNKVVLVNFWATWCGPCRREIPHLIALQRELKDKGFEVIGLTVEDPEADRGNVQEFVQRLSINYKIGFSPREMFYIFNGADPRGPIPQTFIFDRNGKLVDSVKGLRPDFPVWVQGAVNHALSSS